MKFYAVLALIAVCSFSAMAFGQKAANGKLLIDHFQLGKKVYFPADQRLQFYKSGETSPPGKPIYTISEQGGDYIKLTPDKQGSNPLIVPTNSLIWIRE